MEKVNLLNERENVSHRALEGFLIDGMLSRGQVANDCRSQMRSCRPQVDNSESVPSGKLL
jgi:hypothetical protein